jgi:hypothetical protein
MVNRSMPDPTSSYHLVVQDNYTKHPYHIFSTFLFAARRFPKMSVHILRKTVRFCYYCMYLSLWCAACLSLHRDPVDHGDASNLVALNRHHECYKKRRERGGHNCDITHKSAAVVYWHNDTTSCNYSRRYSDHGARAPIPDQV